MVVFCSAAWTPCVCKEDWEQACSPSQHLSQLSQLSQAMCADVAPLSPLPCDPLVQGRACKTESCWQLSAAAYPSSMVCLSPIAAVKDLGHPKVAGTSRQNKCCVWPMESERDGVWFGLYVAEKHVGDAGRELPAVPPRSCSSSPPPHLCLFHGGLCAAVVLLWPEPSV